MEQSEWLVVEQREQLLLAVLVQGEEFAAHVVWPGLTCQGLR